MTETISQEATGAAKLPESWEWAAYSELGEWFGGGTPSKANQSYWEDGRVPWFSPKDMRGLELHDSQDHITEDALKNSAAKPIRAGSLLFVVRSGILRRTLPIALTKVEGAVNQDIKALTPSRSLSAKYLLYVTLGQREEIRHTCKKAGTTVESIQVPALQAYRVPIPPLNEQRRIVDKIEELFTKLDAGVRSLEQAREQLKSYRRSVLKAAVEGELSREWREAHKDELEPASELLKRILQEHRERFTGKKYKEPAAPDIAGLPALPEPWCWTSLSAIADTQLGKMLSQAAKTGSGSRPYLRNQNVRWGSIDIRDVLTMDFDKREVEKFSLLRGDVLVCEGGEPGRATVWSEQLPGAMYQKALHRVRIIGSALVPEYLVYHLRKDASEGALERYFTGSTIKHFTGIALSRYAVSLPPLEEQRFIVESVERCLSVVDKLEASIEENLKQAGGLRQSILKRAFSGDLVPQNPDDEPASVLLERIREEREASKQKSGKRRKRKSTTASSTHAEQGGLF